MTRVAAFQHTPNEPLGYIDQILADWDVPFEYHYLWDTNEVSAKNATHLILLGGPMSVNDEAEFPWLQQEKELIRSAVKKNIPVLGLCLGAQLIASAFGARVYKFVNETGWYPVKKAPDAAEAARPFPETFYVFQMHGETFEIPFGGRLLCTGDRVKNQAFQYRTALALQFHLEMTPDLIVDWTKDLNRIRRQRIMRHSERYLAASNTLCRRMLQDFTGIAGIQ